MTGLSSRIAAVSRPFASPGVEGMTTFSPATCANHASSDFECWAAFPRPDPPCVRSPMRPRVGPGHRPIDLVRDLPIDRVEVRGVRDALVDDPRARVGERVEAFPPALDLVLALVLARVAVVVALVAVRVRDEKRRAVSGARASDRLTGRVV